MMGEIWTLEFLASLHVFMMRNYDTPLGSLIIAVHINNLTFLILFAHMHGFMLLN